MKIVCRISRDSLKNDKFVDCRNSLYEAQDDIQLTPQLVKVIFEMHKNCDK